MIPSGAAQVQIESKYLKKLTEVEDNIFNRRLEYRMKSFIMTDYDRALSTSPLHKLLIPPSSIADQLQKFIPHTSNQVLL